jgi:hypothetical protein
MFLCSWQNIGKEQIVNTMAGQQDNIYPLNGNNQSQQGIPVVASLLDDKDGIGKNEKHHERALENPGSTDKASNKKSDIDAEVQRTISFIDDENEGNYDVRKENRFGEVTVIDNAKDLITHVLHVDDNPADSPWTFRALAIGKFGQFIIMTFPLTRLCYCLRSHFVYLRVCAAGDLLLQASGYLCVGSFPYSDCVHTRYTVPIHPTPERRRYHCSSMPLPKPSRFQF